MPIKKIVGLLAVISVLFIMPGCSEEDKEKVETIVHESDNEISKSSETINVKFTSDAGEEWIANYSNIDLNNVDPDLVVDLLTVIADRKSGNFILRFSINEEIPPEETPPEETPPEETPPPSVDMESGVKRTGQLIAYEEVSQDADGNTISTIMNDDGYYRSGVEISYSRNDEQEIVTDNVTKLMWQDSEKSAMVTKTWSDVARYNAGKYDSEGDTAVEYCNDSALAEYKDWRLPSIKELQSIITYAEKSPATDRTFKNSKSSAYWTFTTNINEGSQAWGVGMSKGKLAQYNKNEKLNVRCVRTFK